ncbi:MAG: class I SAM-dependent methyltransferase [Alkalicoccus sp.]|nr:MAG: class I SAM-dependent methyltransferase [Alkalicoccus sp.]
MRHFASLYDELMEEIPYRKWLEYTKKNVPDGAEIVDTACGTGSFTLLLEKEGFKAHGVDISGEMLAEADQKAWAEGSGISFYEQNMTELNGFENMDAVTLFCDGLNYLSSGEEVQKTFQQAAASLKQGGVFLFDVHSVHKMENEFFEQLYGEDRDNLTYMWYCEPGEEPMSVHHILTFFLKKENGSYERYDEELYQRTFEPSRYKEWLESAGFYKIELSGDFGKKNPGPEDDRYFFKAVKK